MFGNLWRSIRDIIEYNLPVDKRIISAWEKERLNKLGKTEYRLSTQETDSSILAKLDEISYAAGLQESPKLIIHKEDEKSGVSLANGTIVISTGVIEKLSNDELKAVLGHEVTHNLHKKTSFLGTLAFALSTLITAGYVTPKIIKTIDIKNPIFNVLSIVGVFSAALKISERILEIPLKFLARTLEKDADRGAIILTGNSDGTKSFLLNLKKEKTNTIETHPVNSLSKLHEELVRTHPHLDELITHAEKVKKEIERKGINNVSPTRFF